MRNIHRFDCADFEEVMLVMEHITETPFPSKKEEPRAEAIILMSPEGGVFINPPVREDQ